MRKIFRDTKLPLEVEWDHPSTFRSQRYNAYTTILEPHVLHDNDRFAAVPSSHLSVYHRWRNSRLDYHTTDRSLLARVRTGKALLPIFDLLALTCQRLLDARCELSRQNRCANLRA